MNESYEAEGEFSCSLCEKSFQFESILQKHLKIDHETLSDDQIQKCWICNEEFVNRSRMAKHVNNVHNETKAYKCNQCEKAFAKFTLLRDHIWSFHEGVKNHHCEICKQSFSFVSGLAIHMNRHHPESVTVKEPKAHQCTLCPRNFKFKSRLISHVKKDHEKEKEVLLEIMKSEKTDSVFKS